ncbi:MAG TPA: RDD family protein [Chitinophagales bacterium]|nr:RDD family protein [Chitinophagales bacterium]
MQTIDVNTTQNVTIQYDLASVRDRIIAFIIDAVILSVSIALLSAVLSIIFGGLAILGYVLTIVLVSLFFFYSLGSEILMNGQSFGKRILGLKIVKITGKEASIQDYVIRWAFRFIDIWGSSGSIAVMMISSSNRNQRLGDLMANTAVIKLNPGAAVSFREILSFQTMETYKPVYFEAKKFSEQDVLLIKQTIDRFNRYKNQAHKEVIQLLAEKISEELGLEKIPSNQIQFLQTVVNDYVVLSR